MGLCFVISRVYPVTGPVMGTDSMNALGTNERVRKAQGGR